MSKLPSFGDDKFDKFGLPEFIVACNNGFRSWELAYDHENLTAPFAPSDHHFTSLVMKYEWTPGINRATCMASKSIVQSRTLKGEPALCEFPTKRCQCGFYAYYDVDSWSSHPDMHSRFQRVHGVIEGFGHCVVGSKGFRAQSALITGLLIPDTLSISKHWLGRERSPEQGRDALVDILKAKFPTVPLYDRLDELLANSPLIGKPRVITDMEDE